MSWKRARGDPVVLIHGSASLIQDFVTSGLVDRLAQTRRVIVLDRPGYGHSARPRATVWTPERQAALLIEACAQLGVERPVVLGHSWGTLVALAWALDHPRRSRGWCWRRAIITRRRGSTHSRRR
jgi:pimeloyl-ACP methyl ester carboxylesterase